MTAYYSECQKSEFMKITEPSGYIASIVTEETSCGSPSSPWVIEGKPEQRVNLTIFNFEKGQNTDPLLCVLYATLEDGAERRSVCAPNHREDHIFISMSNMVKVRVYNEHKNFLLKYEGMYS